MRRETLPNRAHTVRALIRRGATGGDVIDLWAYIWGISRKAAVKDMMETLDDLGIDPEENIYLMGHE